ncbi:hypothetical protein KSP40_PGU006967 [Platanthera guangdongensis]|uniref:Uncharacterized protein n=1 Tax=Platanthera guangdongensis TaxID=2320717 RepID=A0ABR2LM58_9ASPA
MRCKIHPSDAPGVCATCLRERLTALAAAVANASEADFSSERRRYLGRSASSDTFGLRPAGPIHGRENAAVSEGGGVRRRHFRRFTFFSDLLCHFRHRETESNAEAKRPSRSRSWLSVMIRGKGRLKKKKKTSQIVLEDRVIGRGMSPAEKEETMGYDSDSGYQTEPPLKGPRDASSPDIHYGGHNFHSRFTGLSLCFSPLMRPSGQTPSEVAFSGELRGTFNAPRQRYGGTSAGGSSGLGPNRSRKIADFGKFR